MQLGRVGQRGAVAGGEPRVVEQVAAVDRPSQKFSKCPSVCTPAK